MKRNFVLLTLGVVLRVLSRRATPPLNSLPEAATPEAWPLD
jgi:hypothetical protein